MKIVVIHEDDLNDAGEAVQHDITEGVKALYDLAVESMDYGSGFWTVEDAVPVAELARTCGFNKVEELERYVEGKRREENAEAARRAERVRARLRHEKAERERWGFFNDV